MHDMKDWYSSRDKWIWAIIGWLLFAALMGCGYLFNQTMLGSP